MTGFHHELRDRARSAAGAPALLAPGRDPLTFGGMLRQAEAVTATLRGAGVRGYEAVAVVLPDGPELITTFLGVTAAAVCAPLNPLFREAEIEFCLASIGPAAVITDPALNSAAATVARRMNIPVFEATGGALKADVRSPDGPPHKGMRHPDGAALLLHTSGTTSTPKLVPLTRANLREMAGNTQRILGLTAADRFFGMMPLFHLQGLMSALAQLTAGGSVVCTSGFNAERFLDGLEEFRPTWYTAGPALHRATLESARTGQDGFARVPLRFVRSIGAAMPPALLGDLETALGVPVLEGYGMTEAGVITSNALGPGEYRAGSTGRSAGLEVAVMDGDGAFLPPDHDGEIVVRGPAVMLGYAGPQTDGNTFRDGWFRTGDLGRLDGVGFLYITGRLKEIINRGGEKILPGEIDDALKGHPAVEEATAFGVPHRTLGEDVAAAVVLRRGAEVSEGELRSFAASRLAEFKTPRQILFVESIPKSATGKPRRAALAEQVRAAGIRDASNSKADLPEAVLTEAERRMTEIWGRVLKVDRPGLQDDFFRLGGDSFALTLLVTELEYAFGCGRQTLEAAGFFAEPTIATLCRIVTAIDAKAAAPGPFVTLQPNGDRIPFFCFPGAEESPHGFRALSAHLGPDQPFHTVRDPRQPAERGLYTVEQAAAMFSAAIREKQPRGPYIVGGHCYGGMLAFEVARQLQAAGGDVRLVVMMESAAPGYPKVLRHWRDYLRYTRLLPRAVAHVNLRIGPADVAAHLAFLGKLLGRKVHAAVRRRATAHRELKPLLKPPGDVYGTNREAARIYEPQPAALKVVQFIAAGEDHRTLILDDPRLGWQDVAGGGFAVRSVPGKLIGMFGEPRVQTLAAQLRELLDAENATATGLRAK